MTKRLMGCICVVCERRSYSRLIASSENDHSRHTVIHKSTRNGLAGLGLVAMSN
ncbi:MAG: hypothetical protein ACPGRG_09780 [Marinomonas sp.]